MRLFTFVLLSFSLVFADKKLPKNFFIFQGDVISIQRSKIESPDTLKGQETKIALSNESLTFHHMKTDETALRFEVSHEWFHIDWKENPNFCRENFNLIIGQVGFFTDHFENWWILFMTGLAFDLKNIQFQWFSQWRTTLYARYNYHNKFRIHVGLLGYLGFRYNEVYPIIGIDFNWKKLQVNLVFPQNISLEYKINPSIIPYLKLRFLTHARRLDKDEPRSLGAFRYEATGLEGGLRFVIKKYANLDVYVGHTGLIVEPRLRVEGRNGTNRIWYDIKSSFYGGISFFVPF